MNTLSFNGVTLTPVYHDNQIYLTSVELAKALGYSQENAVLKVYHRNADEFSADMTQLIANPQRPNLGQRIFNLRGCHLIAMFARTPVAKEFRKWVLDVLEKEVGAPTISPVAPNPEPATSPRLSAKDLQALRHAVRTIAQPFSHANAVIYAIYGRLRAMCEVGSISQLRYEHLEIIKRELARIDRIFMAYHRLRYDTEITLMRRVCIDDDTAVWDAIRQLDAVSTDYAMDATGIFSHTRFIDQIGGAL